LRAVSDQLSAAALVGTWNLRSYRIEDPGGRVIDVPYGEAPVGTLIYTAQGRVSVHAMAPDRTRCGTARINDCLPEVKIAAFDSFFSYVGRYSVAGAQVRHYVDVASFPDWQGAVLRRTIRLAGDVLVLRGPIGVERLPVLTWTREGDRP